MMLAYEIMIMIVRGGASKPETRLKVAPRIWGGNLREAIGLSR
jgi:hypothetical protein